MNYLWTEKVEEMSKKGNFREIINFLKTIDVSDEKEELERLLRLGILEEKVDDIKAFKTTSKDALLLAKKIGDETSILRAFVLNGYLSLSTSEFEEGLLLMNEALEIDKGRIPDLISGDIHYLAGIFNHFNGNDEKAFDHLDQSIEIRRGLGKIGLISHVLNAKAVIFERMGEIQSSLINYHLSMEIKEKEGDLIEMARGHHNIATFYYSIGELSKASKHIKKSEKLFKKIGSGQIHHTNFTKSLIEYSKGNLDEALKFTDKCISHFSKKDDPFPLMNALKHKYSILQKKGLDCSKVVHEVEELLQKKKNNKNLQIEGILFKANHQIRAKRPKEKFGSYDLLDQVIDKGGEYREFKIRAKLLKCKLLLDEISIFNEMEAIRELESLAEDVLDFGNKQKSPFHQIKGLVLKAKLKVLKGDLKTGISIYRDAFKIAQDKGIEQMTKSISLEYEREMQKLNSVQTSPSNLWNFIDDFLKPDGEKEPPKEEQPIMVVIINRSGIAKYARIRKNEKLNVDLIASFISALQAFLKEAFNREEHMKYISNESYGLVFEEWKTNTVCYVFNGNPYYPFQKISMLKEKIVQMDDLDERLNGRKSLDSLTEEHLDLVVDDLIF